MVYNADQTAQRALNTSTNKPGYCLQQCRTWAGIGSMYGDATTAWKNTNDRHPGNKSAPRGSMVYWTGGSHGYGHIAVSLGNGKVRSTDAGGSGKVATVSIDWPTTHWGLPYAGWAWDVNEVTIPHGGGGSGGDKPKDDDMPLTEDDLQKIASRVNHVLGDYNNAGQVVEGVKPADAERANQRLNQIENVVRRIEDKVNKLSG